jgi:dTDP-4-dehydrorhamnose reductase
VRVAVLGGAGQLGTDVIAAFRRAGHTAEAIGHDRVEIASEASVRDGLGAFGPDFVVNAAAFHHVEKCEQEPERAFAVNALGARHVARFCREIDAPVLYVSTDYVFDGAKGAPYVESDLPRPLNVYGNSKLSGEGFTRTETRKHYVVRVSGLYGTSPCRGKGLNFVELMLKLARERGEVSVVDDEVLAPTSTASVAEQVVALAQSGRFGLYHAASHGSCSWHDFAAEIFRATGTPVTLKRALPGQFPMKVPRPTVSVLDNAALREAGLDRMLPWREALGRYLDARDRELATR